MQFDYYVLFSALFISNLYEIASFSFHFIKKSFLIVFPEVLINVFHPTLANCNFDTGDFCNWRPSTKSTFLWSIGSGQTPSGLASGGVTGPTADSSGSGKQYD